MNGIEKIIARIQSDASDEVSKIESKTEMQCKSISISYDKKAKDTYDLMITEATKDAKSRIERRLSVAALDTRKMILETKQKSISEVFERAAEMLTELDGEEYTAFLARLAADASVAGDEKIRLSERDAHRFGSAVCEKANALLSAKGKYAALTLSDKYADIRGGIILSSGNIEVNCSVDTLVSQIKPDLSYQVASALFD